MSEKEYSKYGAFVIQFIFSPLIFQIGELLKGYLEMKKIIGLFLAAAAWSVFAGTEGTVAVSVLNARKEPTVKSPVMMKLKSGAKVSILRRCGENWFEIALPPDAPVYVDESLVVGGKAHRNIRMYSGRGRKYPVWGELRKGEKVELQDDRAYGWARIAPPERLRRIRQALSSSESR